MQYIAYYAPSQAEAIHSIYEKGINVEDPLEQIA